MLAECVPEDGRLAVYAGNSVEFAVAIVAAMQAGISSVPINFRLIASEAEYILADSNTTLLFVGPETVDSGLEAAAKAGVRTVVGWRCDPREGLVLWEDWLAQSSAAEPPVDRLTKPHLLYTSGTTGRPKGVETPPNQFPPATSAAEFFPLLEQRLAAVGGPSPILIVSPMYHSGPMNWIRHIGAGATAIIMSKFDPEKVLEAIDTYKVQGLMMVPTHMRRLLALPEDIRKKYDVASLKYVTHTGAACPREVKKAMIDWWGPVFLEAYGGTESGNVAAITSHEWLLKPGSVGKNSYPYEGLVIGENGERLGPNQEGRLYFRDTTGRGVVYFNDPEKTAAAHLEPGVFTLGEIGYYDEDGYLFITDRFSDMVVSGGVNIYPAEIEKVLVLHPEVGDVAVFGVPNADMGEEVCALIIPRHPDHPPSPEELLSFCRERLARYKCPASFVFVDDVGRNAIGKINKAELRRRYWTGSQRIG
jgi:long-chain acyl-CoA synthetase